MEICPRIFLIMNKRKILFSIFIIFIGVTIRIFLNEVIRIPNFEAVTSLSLVSGSFLGGVFAPVIPLFIIFLSDTYFGFGHHPIYLFTWSAFILIGIFGLLFKKKFKILFFENYRGRDCFSFVFLSLDKFRLVVELWDVSDESSGINPILHCRPSFFKKPIDISFGFYSGFYRPFFFSL